MKKEASLSLKDGHIDVVVKNGDVNSQKSISYEELSNIFEKRGDIVSPFLPGEYGLQKYVISGNREFYLYLEAPKVVTCKYSTGSQHDEPDPDDYDDDEDYDDAMERYNNRVSRDGEDGMNINKFTAPVLAIMVALTKHSNGQYGVNETMMYALKSPIYTGQETLYRAPFSNVYPDGRICWGHNTVQIPSLKTIQGLSTLFFGAPFNSDLEEGRFNRFRRTYADANANLTLHFQMETDQMLKDPEKTPDDVLEFVHSHMRSADRTVAQGFKDFIDRY